MLRGTAEFYPDTLRRMILENEEEVLNRLESPDNLVNRLQVRRLGEKSKGKACIRVPPMMREIIGIAAAIDGPSVAARELGVTQSLASNSAKGLIQNRFDPDLKRAVDSATKERESKIEDKKSEAHVKALDSLLSSLDLVQSIDVTNLKQAEKVTRIASNLAGISAKLTKRDQENINANNVLIIRAPRQKEMSEYETVDI
jgi:hypothetical protein